MMVTDGSIPEIVVGGDFFNLNCLASSRAVLIDGRTRSVATLSFCCWTKANQLGTAIAAMTPMMTKTMEVSISVKPLSFTSVQCKQSYTHRGLIALLLRTANLL